MHMHTMYMHAIYVVYNHNCDNCNQQRTTASVQNRTVAAVGSAPVFAATDFRGRCFLTLHQEGKITSSRMHARVHKMRTICKGT